MRKTDCGVCRHSKVCKYIDRNCELEEKANYLLTEEDTEVFTIEIVCKYYREAEHLLRT